MTPDSFISCQLQAFEGPFVSTFLSDWIDLVFGYKQKGNEAINHFNVFFHLTYPGVIDLNSLDTQTRGSVVSQATHFGQCPLQSFTDPHLKKRLSLYSPRPLRNTMLLSHPSSIYHQTSPSWLGSHCRLFSISDMDSSLLAFKPTSYQSILGRESFDNSNRYFDPNSVFYSKDHTVLSPAVHLTWPPFCHAPWNVVIDCNEYMMLECLKIGIAKSDAFSDNLHSSCYSIEFFSESNQWLPVENCSFFVCV